MTNPDPASVLDAAREAVRLSALVEGSARGSLRGFFKVYDDWVEHADKHYGAIAAALVEASERERELRAEVERIMAQGNGVNPAEVARLRAPNNDPTVEVDHEQDGA